MLVTRTGYLYKNYSKRNDEYDQHFHVWSLLPRNNLNDGKLLKIVFPERFIIRAIEVGGSIVAANLEYHSNELSLARPLPIKDIMYQDVKIYAEMKDYENIANVPKYTSTLGAKEIDSAWKVQYKVEEDNLFDILYEGKKINVDTAYTFSDDWDAKTVSIRDGICTVVPSVTVGAA